jgi:hypothetical protein
LKKGEALPDFPLVMKLCARVLEGSTGAMVEADAANEAELSDDEEVALALSKRVALRIQGDVTYAPITRDVVLADEVVWTTLPVAVGASVGVVTFF